MSSSGDDQAKMAPPAVIDEEVKAAANSPKKDLPEKAPHESGPNENGPSAAVSNDSAKPVTVRIAKDSQLRRLITYVMAKLQAGSTVTLQALTLQVFRAVNVASIVRDRIGNVHQVNSLLVVEENPREGDTNQNPRSTSGIQIVLSLDPLNDQEVGYQKPKPKGYAQQFLGRRPVRRDTRPNDGPRDAKQQAPRRNSNRNDQDDKSVKDAAPRPEKSERQRRRRGSVKNAATGPATSTEKETKKKKDQAADKNGQKQQEVDDTKSQKSTRSTRRNRSRKRSKTTERVESGGKSDLRTDNDRNAKDRPFQDDTQSQKKGRATSRQSNRRRRPEMDDDAPPSYDLDHLGRPIQADRRNNGRLPPTNNGRQPQNGNGRQQPTVNGRPFYGRSIPYQYGQSHRYIMDYHQDDRDEYFDRFDQGYGPNYYGNGRPQQYKMGGQDRRGQSRPGYFPASSRPKNPDQLMGGYDRPPGRQIGSRGGYSAAGNRF